MSEVVPTGARSRWLRRLGINLGPDTYVASRVMLKAKNLTTGRGCFINHGVHFDAGPISLGNNVFIGPGAVLVSNDHQLGSSEKRAGVNVHKPITVGDGAWIGARVVILGGVDVAPGCVVASGAVLTKSTTANGIYAGVPARRIKDL